MNILNNTMNLSEHSVDNVDKELFDGVLSMEEKTFITFIIPTIGRNTLINSISSLLNQDDTNWKAIIIFDGIEVIHLITDDRIEYLSIPKTGNEYIKNVSGLVRNYGIKYINDNIETEWIGFLDDDDTLSNDYISKLKEEILFNNNIDVCLFRMCYSNGYILPSLSDKNIIRNKVGISFAIKSYIAKDNLFNNNPFEDYFFLKNLQSKKYKILISSYITYFVRTNPIHSNYTFFPKILL